jgi:hypothetical protein
MSDENALASLPALAGDQLLAVAEAAEKRIDAVNRIKGLALRVTNYQDWTDQGGKPYLQVSGSEKVARLFGISWRLNEPVREEHDDGHYSYTIKGYFSMGAAEIEVVGTRSSKDPFFSRNGKVPVTEIDRNDVKKGAMTNCIGNGITRLLGIRNLTWDEVRSGGVNQSKVSKVEYKKKSAEASSAARAGSEVAPDMPLPPDSEPAEYIVTIGRQKNQSVSQQTDENLLWVLDFYNTKGINKPEAPDAVMALEEEKAKRGL